MADSMSDGHREQRVGLLANRMGMGDRCVLSRPFGHMLQIMVGSKDAQRADPHHRPIGLAAWIGTTPQASGDCRAAIEGPGIQPKNLRFSGFLGIVPALVHKQTGQQKGHLGIVGRLPGNRVQGAPVGKLPDTVRVFPPDVLLRTKLDQAAVSVSGELTKEAALGTINLHETPQNL